MHDKIGGEPPPNLIFLYWKTENFKIYVYLWLIRVDVTLKGDLGLYPYPEPAEG